jgi:hypothetical protein
VTDITGHFSEESALLSVKKEYNDDYREWELTLSLNLNLY